MPGKRKGKSKGTVMTLGDFQGDHVGNDKYNLPTMSSGASRYDDRDRHGRDRGSRYGRDDRNDRYGRSRDEEEPSRADESGAWRSARGSGRSGFSSDDRSGGGDWRRDRGGFGGDSRFGGDRYGRSGGFGDRNDRFGGFGDRNDRRDDRPAHLRRLGKQRSGDSSQLNSLSSAGSRTFAALGNDSDALDAKAEAQRAKEAAIAEQKRIQATRNVDDSLKQTESTEISKLRTKLNEALEQKRTVTVKEITGNLAGMDIKDEEVSFRLGVCLAKSLSTETLTLDELVDEVETDRLSEYLVMVLSQVKALESSAKLTEVVAKSTKPIASLISGDLSGADLDAFLTKVDLFELKPVPNMQKSVMAALKDGKGPDAALALIEEAIDKKLSVSYLVEPVVNFMMKVVLEDSKNPALGEFEKFQKLVMRCISGEEAQQVAMVFQIGDAWFTKGKVPTTIKPIFMKLHELGIIPHKALQTWKDSKQKSKSKMQVLLKLSMWIKDIEPVVVREEEDEDEDEEEFDENLGLGGYAAPTVAATTSSDAW